MSSMPRILLHPKTPLTYIVKSQMPPRKERPSTIFSRQPRRQYTTTAADIDFYVGVSEFGKDAPKIAIGSSRKPPKPPPETPGPGFYDPPDAPKDSRIKIRLSETPKPNPRRPLTANVDYINAREFPRVLQKCIGVRDGFSYIQPGEGPPCRYMAPSQLSHQTHRIANKAKPFYYDDLRKNTPGPERYTPLTKNRAQARQCQLLGPKYRDDWLTETEVTPAPDYYNPRRVSEARAPQFSFGSKSRKKKGKKLTPFAIDQVIVNLEGDISVEEAREYVVKHPVLKKVVREIMSVIRQIKPAHPLEFLRNYFEDDRKRMMEKMEMGDELDLNKIIVHLARVERESEQKRLTIIG